MTATPEAVKELRRLVATFAADLGVPDPPLADVKLAVSEAVTNVVVHSYRAQDEPGPVGVHAEHGPHELRIVVVDQGQGCTTRTDSPGAGLGIGLMSRLADRVEIRSASPRGTEVHLSFALTA